MKVRPRQKWRHLPSGDVREVIAIVTYQQRVGKPPRQRELERGIDANWIAVMGLDRRDSSDMLLTDEMMPIWASDWERVCGGLKRAPTDPVCPKCKQRSEYR